jgi:hypothetical protein
MPICAFPRSLRLMVESDLHPLCKANCTPCFPVLTYAQGQIKPSKLKVAGSNPAGVTTSFVPNPGISGFQPDKRQMRRTLLVRPGHRRLRHQKSACGSRAPIGSN